MFLEKHYLLASLSHLNYLTVADNFAINEIKYEYNLIQYLSNNLFTQLKIWISQYNTKLLLFKKFRIRE